MMNKKIFLSTLVAILLVTFLVMLVSAKDALFDVDPQITWSVVGGGGGHVEIADGMVALDSTIGQATVGEVSAATDGDTAELCAGFWCAWESWLVWFKAYLPITLQE